MGRIQSWRWGGFALLSLALLALAGCGSSSVSPSATPTHSAIAHSPSPKPALIPDVRGTWTLNSSIGSVSRSMTLHITTENSTSGVWSGNGTEGSQTSSFTGTVVDPTFTYQITSGGYSASGTGLLVMLGTAWSIIGNFTDSNKKSGNFTVTRVSTT